MLVTPLYLPFGPFDFILVDIFPIRSGYHCKIVFLQMAEEQRKRGLGTLLLSYALF